MPLKIELENKISTLEERIEYLEKLNQELHEHNQKITKEYNNVAEVLSFLPDNALNQIKIKGEIKHLRYKMATVLFLEISEFTDLSLIENSVNAIDELDEFFLHFDKLIKKYNLQKTKSLGDTYVCVGGIPQKNRTNPIEIIMVAIEMQQYFKQIYESKKIWNLKLGIHTGPVIANIYGNKKKNYDIKGNTVNIAARIKSISNPNTISISETTYELVKDMFACEYKTKIPIKYRGSIPVYSVKGYRPELSQKTKDKPYNNKFFTKYQKIQFEDLNHYVLDRLERELPKHLYYHNLKHTIDVTISVEIIGTGEEVSEQEMILLKTAALFHDFGQIYGALNHEERSAEIAQTVLPRFNYTPQQIDQISQLIIATKLPPNPKTILEKIIADADLDYLGRDDFIPISNSLYRELKVQGMVQDLNEWNKLQIEFLSKHQFFTKTAQNMRLINKEKQIERIKKLII